MNKAELVEEIASSTGESRRLVQNVLDTYIDVVQKQVKKGEKVSLPGFGTFERRARAARTARNPQTGDPIKVKASKVPAFKPGAGFKSFVNGAKK